MYKLLIVDDESYILDWLFALFMGKNEMNLDIYTAGCGSKALEIINNTRIDIIVTDISMPGMSGLELLERVKKNWPACQIIIFTGTNNFDYVYEAIQYEKVKYLLKMEKDEKIIEAVENAIREIDRSVELERILEDSRRQAEDAKPLLQKELLLNILYGVHCCQDKEPLNQLEITLNPQQSTVILLCSIKNIAANISSTERNRFYFAVKLLVNQNVPDSICRVQTMDDQVHLIWLLQSEAEEGLSDSIYTDWQENCLRVKGALEKVQDICLDSFHLNVSFAMSDKGVVWENLSEEYARLKSFLYGNKKTGNELVLFTEENKVCHEKGHPEEETEGGLSVKMACMKLGQLKILENYLESGHREEFHLQLASLIECLRNVQCEGSLQAFELYNSVSLMYLSYINRRGISDRIAAVTDLQKLVNVRKNNTWSESVDFLYEVQEAIFEAQSVMADSQVLNVVSKIKLYIDQNLSGDLSLIKLADLFHFNSSYLSRLFKTGTKTNLSDYIFNKRIEQGKKLLEENKLKVQEIAFAVGYDSPKSFARLFKKSQGVTPQEYRNFYLLHNNMSLLNTKSKAL